MYESIVVGVDGSTSAASAFGQAAELAERFGAHLHVVSAYTPLSVSGQSLPPEFAGTVRSDSKVEALLSDLSSRARVRGIEVSSHSRTGDPATAIVEVADEQQADLIIVGNKGMKARRVLGSVPNSVAHKASCSTLIVQTT
ncbi:MAG: universal stress protein [Acidimicrobiales bacterium]